MRILVYAMLCAVFASGCASAPNRTGPAAWVADAIAGDGPGLQAPAVAPEPLMVENLPKSRRGNPSEYTVGGVRYAVMTSAEGYAEQGQASWYGRKFHGRETSSGEVYDMYQLTAAHKHLPLPTFVRVTRIDTGDSIVVKVNDRGPFVDGRVIDLSFQAAATLGIVKDGTAPVLVEALSSHLPAETIIATTPNTIQGTAPAIIEVPASAQALPDYPPSTTAGHYLQLGAFSDASNAENLAGELSHSLPVPVVIDHDLNQSLFRVWVGPIKNLAERDAAVVALRANGVSQFTMVTSTH